jgi:NAD(P)-dependent dehydrogenase (short-subunit alcohol dehydrogenase family)
MDGFNKRVITKEGVETNFAVNYLSRFIITTMLLPLLSRGGKTCNPAKILIINGAATGRKINFEDVNLKSNFGLIRFVGQQCYANDLFAIALDEKLRNDSAIHIRVNVLKLGVVKTNIRKTFPPLWMKWMVRLVLIL